MIRPFKYKKSIDVSTDGLGWYLFFLELATMLSGIICILYLILS